MQRGRRDDRTLLARLRARSPWPFRHREQPKLDALGGDMLVAFLTAHAKHGFFVTDGGGEFVLLLGAACIALAASGAGRISRDRCTAARHARG